MPRQKKNGYNFTAKIVDIHNPENADRGWELLYKFIAQRIDRDAGLGKLPLGDDEDSSQEPNKKEPAGSTTIFHQSLASQRCECTLENALS